MTLMEQLTRQVAKAISDNEHTVGTSVVEVDEIVFVFNDIEYVCEIKRVTR